MWSKPTLEAVGGGKSISRRWICFFNEAFDVFPGSKQVRPRPVATGHREGKQPMN